MFTLRLNKLIFVPTIIICLLTFLSMLNKSIITKVFQVKKKHVIFSGLLGMYQRKKSMRPYCVSMLTLLQLYICCGCLSNWDLAASERGGEREEKEKESTLYRKTVGELLNFIHSSLYFDRIAYALILWRQTSYDGHDVVWICIA